MSEQQQQPATGRSYQLPSRGEWYKLDGDQPAIPEGRVQLRRLTFDEEALLNTPGMDFMAKLKRIVASACTLPNKFAHEELLITDRMALMLALRTITLGPNYSFPYRCRNCGANNKHSTNIDRDLDEITPEVVRAKLAEKYERRGEPAPPLTEPWSLKLVDAGVTVELRFLRGKDEDRIYEQSKRFRMQSVDPTDPSHKLRIALQVTTVDGKEMSQLTKEQWVRTLSMGDSVRIQNSVDDRETAIDTTLWPVCRACGGTSEVKMAFDNEFFRPTDL